MEKKEPTRGHKPHVLLVPYPVQGHINPMLQFSKCLASKGVRATTVYIAKSTHSVPDHLVQIETFSDGYDGGGCREAESDEAYVASLREVGSRTLTRLVEKLNGSGHRVSALVFDGALPWAMDVARRFGILKVIFFTQSCAVSNVYYHANKGFLGFPLVGPVVSLPGLPPLGRPDLPSFVEDRGSYPAFLDLALSQFDEIDEVDWLLHNTFYELESHVVDWMAKRWRVRTIGPTVPSMHLDKRLQNDTRYNINFFKPSASNCKEWLSGRPRGSVVYVSFGSISELNKEQMEEIGCALKQSGYNFLWVVREAEQAKLPEKFIETTLEKGLVVAWCHQLEVLADESIGCFVTHCGLNSVLEALSLGVPLVAAPLWVDQPMNAKFVEDVWEIGTRAWPDEKGILRRGELEVKIKEVMEGEKGVIVKKNVVKWMGLAKKAMEEGGSSDKNIDEFVTYLVTSSC